MAAPGSARHLPLAVIVIAGCIIAAVTFGARASLGLFTLPMTADMGWSRESYGLAMAIQNLVWGFAQPVAGGLADRYGTARVLAAGAVIYALGLAGMAFAPDEGILFLTAGLMMGIGIGTASFGIVMAGFGRAVPPEKRSLVFGVATAASSLGQFIFAPLGQAFISSFGWQMALVYLAVLVALVIPLTPFLTGKSETTAGEADLPFMQALAKAWGHGSYKLLVIGFFVCGFHLAFVTVHMPAYLIQCGLSARGRVLVDRHYRPVQRRRLASRRLARRQAPAPVPFGNHLFLARRYNRHLPDRADQRGHGLHLCRCARHDLAGNRCRSPPDWSACSSARAISACSTASPSVHQVGGFLGVWLGGLVYDTTGSYALIWYLGVLLGLGSAAIHLPIRERIAPNFMPRPA